MTPETASQIAALRQKYAEGTATLEDMRLAVRLMREDRLHALRASEGARRKAAKVAIPSADDMLAELGDL